jgi:hypothetical protein
MFSDDKDWELTLDVKKQEELNVIEPAIKALEDIASDCKILTNEVTRLTEEKIALMQEVDLLKMQLMESKAQILNREVTPWEPKGGSWYILIEGVRFSTSSKKHRQFGLVYETEEQAKLARDNMRTRNRLLAYVAEHDIDENGNQWVPVWKDNKQPKGLVLYDGYRETYEATTVWGNQLVGAVYMSQKCAEKLAKDLNSGRVKL